MPVTTTFSVGQILTASETTLLASPPLFVGTQTTGQAVTNSTSPTLVLDTNVIDTYNGHSTVTNNTRYVCQLAGWYMVVGQVGWPSNATGARTIQVMVNGAVPSGGPKMNQIQALNGGTTNHEVSWWSFLNVGDYVEIALFQNSGSTLTLPTGQSSMRATWIHA